MTLAHESARRQGEKHVQFKKTPSTKGDGNKKIFVVYFLNDSLYK